MAFTKIAAAGIGSTETVTIDGLSVINDGSFGGNVSVAGTLTYEDVTNIDSVGLITARSGVVVGSGVTLSKDGDGFFTGIVTATTFSGDGSGLTGVASTDNIRTNTNATFLQNVNVVGTGTFGSHVSLGDSDELRFGAGTDLKIYHSSSDNHSYIVESGSGSLLIQASRADILNAAGDEFMITAFQNGGVSLYYDNSKKLETASGGVTVTGTLAATAVTGDGSGLTGLAVGVSTASAQVSGITTVVDISKDDIRLDVTGNVTIDTVGGEEGQSKTLRIVNSGISTVSFNSYFKFPSGGTPNLPTASGAISIISFTVHTQGRVGVASVFLAGASVNFS